MARRGGCCTAMYARAGGDVDMAWKVGRMMLQFRPIAPRPAAANPIISAATPEAYSPLKRPKRKRSANGSGGSRKRGKTEKVDAMAASLSSSKDDDKSSFSSLTTSSSTIVTLQLIPEAPERKDAPAESTAWMRPGHAGGAGAAAIPLMGTKGGSWVTVDCVTGAWREGEVTLRRDESVQAELAADECPGFVSDIWERVTWINEAYRRMVAVGGKEESEEEAGRVELVTRGLMPSAWACRAFTCRVRVRYAVQPGRGNFSSLAAPCDVWRMDSGSCAWRLDVKAALGLGLRAVREISRVLCYPTVNANM